MEGSSSSSTSTSTSIKPVHQQKQGVSGGFSLHNVQPALSGAADELASVNIKSSSPATSEAAAAAAAAPSTTTARGGNLVRRVTLSEYKQAALCLAEAFADDDVCRYFTHTPDSEHWSEAQKWKLHVEIMEYITYAHILKGLVLTVGPNYGCVALWMPPGQNMDDYMTILRSGLWRLYYKLSPDGKTRFFDEFFPLLHDTKQEVMGARDDDSWYLVYIGTKAAARGNGYARKLIEYVTSMADFEGRACYLESSNAINPAIYRKLGFESIKKIELADSEKRHELEIMVREPVMHEKVRLELPPALTKVDSMFASDASQLSVTTKLGGDRIACASVSMG
ncbi:hypothetical protein AAFC00_006878 [Neodothiora populina]|uniref:N-acetyltransferase domain-containing protein n=1 Tax=Neodothiora populina TaxID=2781224 RepID=A0ABR3PBR1_9PEZI